MSYTVEPMYAMTEESCWGWTGHINNFGYGVVSKGTPPNRVRKVAHRVLYEDRVGPVPDDLDLDHLCRNRGCVNPAHLEPVTRQENLRRSPLMCYMAGKDPALPNHCVRGHEFTLENTYWFNKGGGRYKNCRACGRENARRYREE